MGLRGIRVPTRSPFLFPSNREEKGASRRSGQNPHREREGTLLLCSLAGENRRRRLDATRIPSKRVSVCSWPQKRCRRVLVRAKLGYRGTADPSKRTRWDQNVDRSGNL